MNFKSSSHVLIPKKYDLGVTFYFFSYRSILWTVSKVSWVLETGGASKALLVLLGSWADRSISWGSKRAPPSCPVPLSIRPPHPDHRHSLSRCAGLSWGECFLCLCPSARTTLLSGRLLSVPPKVADLSYDFSAGPALLLVQVSVIPGPAVPTSPNPHFSWSS